MKRAAIFDLDGTLADSAPDITAALNHALVGEGLAPFDVASATLMVGAGAKRLIERALVERGVVADGARVGAMMARFVVYYDANPCVETTLYPGARETLEGLSRGGWALGICTNKPEPTARLVLEALGIGGYFGAIVGGREGVALKPAGDMVALALAELGVEASHSVMVGDSQADVGACRAAAIRIILMTHGYTGGVAVDTLGADGVATDFALLRMMLAEIAFDMGDQANGASAAMQHKIEDAGLSS